MPTSVGYGANLGGLAALLAMLNSCARPGILPHRLGQGEGVDHGLDIRQGAVLVVVVLIIMVMGMPMTLFMTMENSCASGVSVVNIDNGFGAGFLAHRINQMKGISE